MSVENMHEYKDIKEYIFYDFQCGSLIIIKLTFTIVNTNFVYLFTLSVEALNLKLWHLYNKAHFVFKKFEFKGNSSQF